MKFAISTTIVMVVIALAVLSSAGQPASATTTYQDDPRFDLAALQGVCSDVRSGSPRSELKVETAAGVQPGDSSVVMQAKIQALFRDHLPRCDGFNVSRGGILKYAVANRAYPFLFAAANTWRVDLNIPDEADGETVLGYVTSETNRSIGRSGWEELNDYRLMLIRAGAKTRAQLEVEGRHFPGVRMPTSYPSQSPAR